MTAVAARHLRADAAAAALLATGALALAWHAGVKNADAVPDVLRVILAAAALATAAGYAPARLLLPRPVLAHFAIAVPVVGTMVSALALTVLGFLGLPLALSLALVIGVGAVGAIVLRVRRGPVAADPDDLADAGPPLRRLAWPALIAALLVAVTLLPMLRAGFATTIGQNGDAVVSVGTAEFLRDSPPRGEDIAGWVDRMPANWRSKYPIYYELAGVSELSGLEATKVMATAMSLMLALTAAGFFLLAYHGLRAGWLAALGVMVLVPLDRILTYLTVQPFYNQMWGVFSMALILLFGLLYLRVPSRGALALLAGFTALGAFAYPLMLPFPLGVVGIAALMGGWRPPRPRLPAGRRGRMAALAGVVVAAPFALVGLAGVIEKGWAAAQVVLPGSDLSGWNALPFYLPFHKFFGLVDPFGVAWLGVAVIIAAALWCCLRVLPRAAGVPFAVIMTGGLLVGAYFKARQYGAFFYFKNMSFLGPLVTMLAVVGLAALARQRSRLVAIGAMVVLGLLALNAAEGTRREALDAEPQLTRDLLDVRAWSQGLPASDSVLIDVPRDGQQLWAGYVLARHPVSGTDPYVSTTFPFPPKGRKADYLLQRSLLPPPPADRVVGRPIRRNNSFRLWRMSPSIPGPDTSSRRSLDQFSSVLVKPER